MNLSRTNILTRFGKQTTLALTVVSLTFGITSNVQAQSFSSDFQLNQNFSGLFGNTNSSKRFFQEGSNRFDTGRTMFNNQRYFRYPLVEISDEVVNREDILELENLQQLLDDGESVE
ncbi:hypothetical protein [Moorena sp. SIO3I6]|uniref:hypothetical protein n=1 Tax=Moorena sp. SIO3I6 TaxID=2607831 RepID=UPI0013F99B6F|nr:hypothetical protein [Moorena sp. SIO3I6]NEP26003.1 hypothetical protein [Moorena sp. SIO3I6]